MFLHGRKSDISEEEKVCKTQQVFDNAIDLLNGYWNTSIDGFKVFSQGVKTSSNPTPYSDFASVNKYTEKSLKQVSSSLAISNIYKELKFFLKHCIKCHNMLEFIKCTDEKCAHCSSHPIRAAQMIAFIRSTGGRCITPTVSDVHTGHYKTFLESASAVTDLKREPPKPDQGLPSLNGVEKTNRHVNAT